MKKPTLIAADGSKFLNPAQQECVELLTKLLEDAQKGNVNACIIVAVGDNDFGVAVGGSDAAKLNLGLDSAKQMILQRTTGGSPRSVIHR